MSDSRPSNLDGSRSLALEALVSFEEAKASMKSILRDFETAADDVAEQPVGLALEVVRHLNTIDFLLTRGFKKGKLSSLKPKDRNLGRMALYEIFWLNRSKEEIADLYHIMPSFLERAVERASVLDLDALIDRFSIESRLSLEHSHPSFLVKTLLDHLQVPSVRQLLQSNNRGRSYYFRVNHLKQNNPAELLSSLSLQGVRHEPVGGVEDLYIVRNGIENLVTSHEFQKGSVLIQDKSSVLAVLSLNVQPEHCVWDACAAPGMKTQLISEHLEGKGCVVASDFYESRIEEALNLTGKLGMKDVGWIRNDATRPSIITADRVLIDAPCTSTGILYSYPSFKWKLNKETLFALMAIQNKLLDGILSAYSNRPGTEIVYATCSILPHEGESQIDSALSRHNVELLAPLYQDSPGYSGFDCSKQVVRLFPHTHDSNGFFIARLRIRR